MVESYLRLRSTDMYFEMGTALSRLRLLRTHSIAAEFSFEDSVLHDAGCFQSASVFGISALEDRLVHAKVRQHASLASLKQVHHVQKKRLSGQITSAAGATQLLLLMIEVRHGFIYQNIPKTLGILAVSFWSCRIYVINSSINT